jgi:predicted RNA-binding Zn-ribbon protein involved in translation (DUF1610 family)
MRTFVGRMPLLFSRTWQGRPGVPSSHTDRAHSHCRTSEADGASKEETLPCPMCDDAHVERHQEMPDATVYVCLACGYRFAWRIRAAWAS